MGTSSWEGARALDPVIKAYADNGIVALSFGLLLLYFLWERRDDRRNAFEERKAQDAERAKFVMVAEQTVTTLQKIEKSLDSLQRDVDAFKGRPRG